MKKTLSVFLLISILITSILVSVLNTSSALVNENVTQSAIQSVRNSLKLVWNDEFGETGDSKQPLYTTNGADTSDENKATAKWSHEGSNTHRNGQVQSYSDYDGKNSWTEDGILHIQARKETVTDSNGTTWNYTSDGLRSSYLDESGASCFKAFRYGMLEARLKVPQGQNQNADATSSGLWNGFWTCGLDSMSSSNTQWPWDGEIDILESWTSKTGDNTYSSLSSQSSYHHATNRIESGEGYHHTANIAGTYTTTPSQIGDTGYHTYGVFYTPEKLVWYVDDNITGSYDITADEFYALRESPQFLLLTFPMGGATCGDINEAFESADMLVDYVRVYQAQDESDVVGSIGYPELNEKSQDLSYYQDAIDDYSHVNVLSVANNTTYNASLTAGSGNWQPAPSFPALQVTKGTTSIELTTSSSYGEGVYDVYLTGDCANWTTGKYKFKLNDSDIGAAADYTVGRVDDNGSTYCDDLSTYLGTAEISNGSHNLKITVERTQIGSNTIGALLRSIVLVGNSTNTPTVTISADSEVATTTTATTTTQAASTTTTTVPSSTSTSTTETTSSTTSTTTTSTSQSEPTYTTVWSPKDADTSDSTFNHSLSVENGALNLKTASNNSNPSHIFLKLDSSLVGSTGIRIKIKNTHTATAGGKFSFGVASDNKTYYRSEVQTMTEFQSYINQGTYNSDFGNTATEDYEWYTINWSSTKLRGIIAGLSGNYYFDNSGFTNNAQAVGLDDNSFLNTDWLENTNYIFVYLNDCYDADSTTSIAEVQGIFPEEKEDLSVDCSMAFGASMRYNEVSGIRYYTNVDIAKISELKASGATVEMGTLIAPVDLLEDNELTFDIATENRIDVKYTANIYYTEDDFTGVVGSIANVKEENSNRLFIGRGYVKVTKDGETTISYATYNDNNILNNSRSISWIATQVRAGSEYGDLIPKYKDIVDIYADRYIA